MDSGDYPRLEVCEVSGPFSDVRGRPWLIPGGLAWTHPFDAGCYVRSWSYFGCPGGRFADSHPRPGGSFRVVEYREFRTGACDD